MLEPMLALAACLALPAATLDAFYGKSSADRAALGASTHFPGNHPNGRGPQRAFARFAPRPASLLGGVRITDGPYKGLTGKLQTVDNYVGWPPVLRVDVEPFQVFLSNIVSESVQIDDRGVVTFAPTLDGVLAGSFVGDLNRHIGVVSVSRGSVSIVPGYTLAGARGLHCSGEYDITDQTWNGMPVFKKRGSSHVSLAWDRVSEVWVVYLEDMVWACYTRAAWPEGAGRWFDWDGGKFVETADITFSRALALNHGDFVHFNTGRYGHLTGRVRGLPEFPVEIDSFECRISQPSSVWGEYNGQWHSVAVESQECVARVHFTERVKYVPQEWLQAM